MAENTSNAGTWVALIVGGLILYQCAHRNSEATADTKPSESAAMLEDGGSDREERVAERADEIRSGEYEDAHGDTDCIEDCSGHEAGFAWARDNDIDDEGDCSSHGDDTGSFAEGCRAYVEAEEEAEEEISDEES